MAKKKTDAYDIGAILGVSTETEETAEVRGGKDSGKDDGIKPASTPGKRAYRTKRDKRLQVVIPQDLYDRLKNEADNAGTSVNEVVNVLLETGLRKRG